MACGVAGAAIARVLPSPRPREAVMEASDVEGSTASDYHGPHALPLIRTSRRMARARRAARGREQLRDRRHTCGAQARRRGSRKVSGRSRKVSGRSRKVSGRSREGLGKVSERSLEPRGAARARGEARRGRAAHSSSERICAFSALRARTAPSSRWRSSSSSRSAVRSPVASRSAASSSCHLAVRGHHAASVGARWGGRGAGTRAKAAV